MPACYDSHMPSPSVVVLGGINMDLVTTAPRFPVPGETVVGSSFLTFPGGKGAKRGAQDSMPHRDEVDALLSCGAVRVTTSQQAR